ncbi:unnamed protein product [Prorocentrum cordatum]|uniref:Secreted protein n=1 Tax=Prorocentrum cordatum TaxID=2364126 RepID=A0ABN9XS50_9DINO|nr:unnamed protein product [Polarella glacialis]
MAVAGTAGVPSLAPLLALPPCVLVAGMMLSAVLLPAAPVLRGSPAARAAACCNAPCPGSRRSGGAGAATAGADPARRARVPGSTTSVEEEETTRPKPAACPWGPGRSGRNSGVAGG